jgi:hypothetical protein
MIRLPRPLQFHRPSTLRPQRLPKRKLVTIAAGFVCADGIVLAADSKESYGEEHTYVDKLTMVHTDHCSAAVTGAGDAELLDFITPRIEQLLQRTFNDNDDLQRKVQELLTGIYGSPAIAVFPVSNAEELRTHFLIAARLKNHFPALFLTASSLVTRIDSGARLIGSGTMRQMADELATIPMDIRKASGAAIYLIYETKRRNNFVGGFTHIYRLYNDGRAEDERTWDQATRETLLDSLRNAYHWMIVSCSDPTVPPKDFRAHMKRIAHTASDIHAEFIRKEKDFENWKENLIIRQLRTKPPPNNHS